MALAQGVIVENVNMLRKFLVFLSIFIGVGALVGAGMMLCDPSGKLIGLHLMLPYFQALPFADCLFRDFTFPAIALLIVNGLTNGVALTLLLRRHRHAIIAALFCGIILMLWISVQFYILPANPMSTAFFIIGAIQAVCAFWEHRRSNDLHA